MTRKRNKITANQIKWLSIAIMVILFLFLSIGYANLNQKLEIKGKANKQQDMIYPDKEIVIEMETTEGPGWYYYTLLITVTNLQKYDIDGWTISMKIPEDTTIAASSKVKTRKQNDIIYFSNIAENSYLAINKSTSFSVEILTQQESYVPSNVKFNGVLSIPEIIPKKVKINKQIKKKVEKINNNQHNTVNITEENQENTQ